MTLMSVVKPVQVASQAEPLALESFEAAAADVLDGLQRACAELLDKVPGSVHRAVDLERGLGLDKKLAWQLFKIARAAQPIAEASHVPVRSSSRRLLDAARRKKVSAKTIQRLERSLERFEEFVAEHGGDREGFLALTSGMGLESNELAELKVRKALFRANTHVWGVQCATMVRTTILHHRPGPDEIEDSVQIIGNIGMQRLRHDARFDIHRFKSHTSPHKDDPPYTPERKIHELGILEEFSTKPLPQSIVHREPTGEVETELLFPVSGRAGAVTLHTSQLTTAAFAGHQPDHGFNTLMRLPTEMFICQALIPRGLTDPATARVAVYGRRVAVERVFELRPADLLPQREIVAHLGVRESLPPIPEAPQHEDAVRHVLGKLGWLGTKFDVYRCIVRYPVLHTMIHVNVDAVRK
jgi:hypothetical protein